MKPMQRIGICVFPCLILLCHSLGMSLALAAPIGSRTFCVDVNALSKRILTAEDRYDDAAAKLSTNESRVRFKEIDRVFENVHIILYDEQNQYGLRRDFAPDHELQTCDDDTQIAMKTATARYNVDNLDYVPPASSATSIFDTGPLTLYAICDLKKTTDRLERLDLNYEVYERRLRRYYAQYHRKFPNEPCTRI